MDKEAGYKWLTNLPNQRRWPLETRILQDLLLKPSQSDCCIIHTERALSFDFVYMFVASLLMTNTSQQQRFKGTIFYRDVGTAQRAKRNAVDALLPHFSDLVTNNREEMAGFPMPPHHDKLVSLSFVPMYHKTTRGLSSDIIVIHGSCMNPSWEFFGEVIAPMLSMKDCKLFMFNTSLKNEIPILHLKDETTGAYFFDIWSEQQYVNAGRAATAIALIVHRFTEIRDLAHLIGQWCFNTCRERCWCFSVQTEKRLTKRFKKNENDE